MAEAIVSFAVERLGDLLIQEASFLHGVTDKIAEIQVELRRMKCFLKDADARRDEDETIRNWVAEIREAAYDAEDTVETFAFKVARRRRSGLQNILKRYACILSEFKALHEVGTEIDAIKNRISSLSTSLQSYNIKSIEGESSGSRNERQRILRRSYSHVVDEDTLGVEGNVKILMEQLVQPDKRCSVVSIWGMGGLGKTTLAKKVYHHGAVRRHFDCFAWSSVSQQFNIRAVVQEILINFMSPPQEQRKEIEKMSDNEVLKRVYRIQEEKKCLVILDDVWTTEAWDTLRPAFPLQKVGSKILLTTRNKAVASHADPQGFLYQPKCLTEEESWELLQRRAFLRNDNDPTINNMEEVGKEMARYCGGLPLAVVVLGGLLATNHTLYDWERIHRNIKSYLMRGIDNYKQQDSGVSNVLALSYQDLSCHLKSCFLYLAHFPEDYEIRTKSLVRMWVAEGIISKVGEQTLEDVAEGYLDELIQRCMVQVGRTSSNGRVHTIQLHDLMRDLCLSKAKEENFLEIIGFQQVETFSSSVVTTPTLDKVRRRAIYLDQSLPVQSDAEARAVSKNKDEDANIYVKLNPENGTPLRSLLIFSPPKEVTVHWMLRKLNLKKFTLLRVLSLEGLSLGEKLPKSIGNLVHLKFLSFKYASLLHFPSSIRNLGCIQTLDLRITRPMICFRMNEVIGRMKWLRHLYLPFDLHVGNSKVQWGNLSNLETLKNFDAVQWDIKDLAHLTKLQKLEVKRVKSFKELDVILKPSHPISSNLRSLGLKHVGTKVEEIDLKQLSMCPHLYKLRLHGEISNLPGHFFFPPNLTMLTLRSSKLKQDPTPILECLLNLTILSLLRDFYIGEEMVFSKNGFPRLKDLAIFSHSVKRLKVDKGAMPNLKNLAIVDCTSLEMVPEEVKYITTLQTLDVAFMPKDFIQRLQVINGKEGEDFYKVEHVPSIKLIDDEGERRSVRP
ncbi:putative disease resistance protein At1g50180 isoform X2 [Vitis riparia]|uniref:putative disease resistance protein At1g50180 isoform X2 n=1 Tax=Vitis riparia TaxID=96939 RepID=UPI00155A36F4|nr:putative disease resistance protein At1g50180 isoform X2 [Vitis riparia]